MRKNAKGDLAIDKWIADEFERSAWRMRGERRRRRVRKAVAALPVIALALVTAAAWWVALTTSGARVLTRAQELVRGDTCVLDRDRRIACGADAARLCGRARVTDPGGCGRLMRRRER